MASEITIENLFHTPAVMQQLTKWDFINCPTLGSKPPHDLKQLVSWKCLLVLRSTQNK